MKPNFYSVLMNQKVDLKISYVLLLSQNMWSLWSISAKNKSIFGSWDTSYVRKHTV